MPTLATLTEDELRTTLGKATYNKAVGYLTRIRNPKRRGETLLAQIQGSRLYEVEVDLTRSGFLGACTCYYNWGNYCKHIGALLLYWVRHQDRFETVSAESEPGLLPPPPTETPKVPPLWAGKSQPDQEQQWRVLLKQYFESQTIQALREIAQQRGWGVRGTRKSDLVDQMLDLIMDRAEAAKGVYSLDPEHQAVLRALAIVGDHPNLTVAMVGELAKMETPLKRHAKIETYTRHLCEQGLAIPSDQSNHYPQMDFMPWVLARTFPPLLETVIHSSSAPEGDQAASDLSFANPEARLRAVIQTLLIFEQQSPELRPLPKPHRLETFFGGRLSGWPYLHAELDSIQQRKDLFQYTNTLTLTVPAPALALPDAVFKQLSAITGDVEELNFIYALLKASGLIQPGSPVTPWAEMKSNFLARSSAEQLAILAKSYFGMAEWNELWLLLRQQPHLQLKRNWQVAYAQYGQLLNALLAQRTIVLRLLAMLPDNRWIKLADLRRLLRAFLPPFSTKSPYGISPESWVLTWDGKQLTDSEEDWQRGLGAFVQRMLTGPLSWLGLVDLSRQHGNVVALRLHGLADLFWDRATALSSAAPQLSAIKESAPAPSAAPKRERAQDRRVPMIDIDQEGRILVDVHAVRAKAHGLLDQIAKMESARPDRFVYRLDAASTHLAFESGVSLDELKTSWREMFGASMPAPIEIQLTHWWESYGRSRIYHNVHLIEFGDDYALTEMKSVTSLNAVMIAELSPRLVLIPKDAIPKLVSELEAAGYTPKQVL